MITTLAPWITVRDAEAAVAFYTAAFQAVETYRMDTIVRLRVGEAAEFWVASDPEAVAPSSAVRFILSVAEPGAVFTQAIAAGASEVSPVRDTHGWRVGRLTDPFGIDWEIGRAL